MKRPRALLAATVIGALVVIAAIALVVIAPWPDPNHKTAEQVVQNAGVPAGATPGPP